MNDSKKAYNILVLDDDKAVQTIIKSSLQRRGHNVHVTAKIKQAEQWVEEKLCDIVISDILMPDGNGLIFLENLKKHHPNLPIIMISARADLLTNIDARSKGAFDFLAKPFDLDILHEKIDHALAKGQIISREKPSLIDKENSRQANISSHMDRANNGNDKGKKIIGKSKAMQDVFKAIAHLGDSNLSVLISGETGTGKELVAQALHDYSPRSCAPFIGINMASIPRDLVESELFGHERGAFTGAVGRKIGRFEQAEGGTLFLDEIGDMPEIAQTRLLRVLQEGEYYRVGGNRLIKSDVRIIAATHRNLYDLVKQGSFREDLFYRLNVMPIYVPPLRGRGDDIAELAHFFINQKKEDEAQKQQLSDEAVYLLTHYHWAGNVRELQNLMHRIAVLYDEKIIDGDIIQREIMRDKYLDTPLKGALMGKREDTKFAHSLEEVIYEYFADMISNDDEIFKGDNLYKFFIPLYERPLLQSILRLCKGNQKKASEMLGINRNTLRKKISEYDI